MLALAESALSSSAETDEMGHIRLSDCDNPPILDPTALGVTLDYRLACAGKQKVGNTCLFLVLDGGRQVFLRLAPGLGFGLYDPFLGSFTAMREEEEEGDGEEIPVAQRVVGEGEGVDMCDGESGGRDGL